MPIYEYKCGCGRRAEKVRPMDERRNLTRCECGKPMLLQLSRSNGFIRLTGKHAWEIGKPGSADARRDYCLGED